MRFLKYSLLIAILAIPLAFSQAQVRFGVTVGGPVYYGPGYVYGPPACVYGYYPYYPYTCAPYGYWGPDYFADGVFIGAGPWFHGFRRFDRDDFRFRHFDRDDRFRGGFRSGPAFRGGGNFHGGGSFQGGGFHGGGGGFHGGGGGHHGR